MRDKTEDNNKYCLENCRIIDIDTGQVSNQVSIIIENETIAFIGLNNDINFIYKNDIKTYNMKGAYILPGLIDSHVHLSVEPRPDKYRYYRYSDPISKTRQLYNRNLQIGTLSGIAVFRDMGSHLNSVIELKRETYHNSFGDPLILTCGMAITKKNGHGIEIGINIDTKDDMIGYSRLMYLRGADFIKIINDPQYFSVELLKSLVYDMRIRGIRVSCHSFTDSAIRHAISAGVHTIEHGFPPDEDMALVMKKRNIAIVPTLSCAKMSLENPNTAFLNDMEIRLFEKWLDDLNDCLPIAIKHGVKILVGTDAGFPPIDFNTVLREIKELVTLGMNKLYAIQCATIIPATHLGLSKLKGSIDILKDANIIAFKNNPIEDIDEIFDSSFIMINGKIVKNNYT